ncbi:MAG: carboxypeptidase-like regulatory domain-containing protein, partial [Gemmatimonadetes bacterium]|nr:carboxypeptidase-like regulatory domain-containing protein [Gemmatimonadota bacterium]
MAGFVARWSFDRVAGLHYDVCRLRRVTRTPTPRGVPPGVGAARRATGFVLVAWCSTVAWLVPSLSEAQESDSPGDLAGTVVDAATGKPLEGALVSALVGTGSTSAIEAARALASPDGSFLLRGVPAGVVMVRVEHLAYGRHEQILAVDGEGAGTLQIRVSPSAIVLEPVVVEVTAAGAFGGRASPSSRNLITRPVIVESAASGLTLGDFLRREVSGISVRRNAQLGGDICIEFRGARRGEGPCNPPSVYLDGTAVRDPLDFFGYFSLDGLESVQFIAPSEAGTRFGPDAGWGVLLLRTRRAGLAVSPGVPMVR